MNVQTIVFAIIVVALTSCRLTPSKPFDEIESPPAPDYSSDQNWAARPDRDDNADVAPAGETDNQANAEVDVFFVHPTTYYRGKNWNQPLDHGPTNDLTDQGVMRKQASAFNAVARIYAPRYRQATLGGYISEDWPSMQSALDLAYEDVAQAFEYYLDNWAADRPLILASHSQGSGHMVRLLHDYVSGADNAALRSRLVAVYAIGGQIPTDEVERTFSDVPICETPDQIGCVVVYNSVRAGERPEQKFERRMWYPDGWQRIEDRPLICVNPVTWRADQERSEQSNHVGGVKFENNDDSPEPDEQWLTAQCADDGYLDVDLIESNNYGTGTGGENFHIVDYALFYMDIRRNAELRVDAFRPEEP